MSDQPGWTSGPNGRSTFDILWTCLATLALCVWTAVHPNILPVPSFRRSLLSRLGMMLIAVVFPEIIISAAWRQLRLLHWLRKEINALHHDTSVKRPSKVKHHSQSGDSGHQTMLPTFEFEATSEDGRSVSAETSQPVTGMNEVELQEKKENDKRAEESQDWTLEQAFFAVMGGFAIENDYEANEPNTKTIIRRLVTAEGVQQLSKLGFIPHISSEDIEERSKADIIAKMFVLSQITWFGLQVIGRLASHIPVTLLEIHTAIHVACTIGIYFMWLKKLYDLHSYVLLDNPVAKDMGALFNFARIQKELHARAYSEYENARVEYWKDRVVRAANNLLDHNPPPLPPVKEALTTAVERYSLLHTDETTTVARSVEEDILTALAPSALRGIETLRKHDGFSSDPINTQNWDLLRKNSENLTIREVWGGWSTDTGHEMSLDKGVHFLFNLIYGGGHLATWSSSSFPTSIEQWLWRGSAIMLTMVPFWGVLWVLCGKQQARNEGNCFWFEMATWISSLLLSFSTLSWLISLLEAIYW